MNIGIIGQGFVGSAVYEGMKNYFDVFAFDKDPNKFSNVRSIFEVVENTEVTFLCVPTPMKKSGECDLGIIGSALNDIAACVETLKKDGYIVVIKSTIPPGTTKVKQIFSKAFPQVPIIKTSSTIAEMIKYVTNTFLATKVSFANEMYQICQGLNIDYDKVIEYARYDERLGNSHWGVPGPDGDFGYGGHCFPKDIAALQHVAKEMNVSTTVLNASIEKNKEVRTDKDWEKQIGRAVSED